MRTLTLGVLIVSGGTLAALPFRRYPVIPDASATPAQVTGPTQSVLDTQAVESPQVIVAASQDAASLPPAPTDVVLSTADRLENPSAAAATRQAEIPLTYEDLVQPIDPPPVVQNRFAATASVRKKQMQQERVAELVMPELETLAVSQQQELRRAVDANALADDAAAGKLASTSQRPPEMQRLPQPQPNERQRYWIRQPD